MGFITIAGKTIESDAEYVNLSISESENGELSKLAPLTRLVHLNASGGGLNDEGLRHVRAIQGLQLLDLDCTDITNGGLMHLRTLDRLLQLRLKDNPQIGDEGIFHLQSLTNLELLHLGNTGVTEAGLAHLKPLKELRTLIFSGGQFERTVLERVKEGLPDCEIVSKGEFVL